MKLTNENLNNLAEDWSHAYRADWCGRPVSIEIIRALLAYGFKEGEAKEVYLSKHLRWFFDSQGDTAKKSTVGAKLTSYLDKNIGHIRDMMKTELKRECSV